MGLRSKEEYQKAVKRLVEIYTKQTKTSDDVNEMNSLLFDTTRFEEENELA